MHILNGRNWWLTSGWRVRCSPHIFRRPREPWQLVGFIEIAAHTGDLTWMMIATIHVQMKPSKLNLHYPNYQLLLMWPFELPGTTVQFGTQLWTTKNPANGWQRYGCWPRVRVKPSIGRWTCTCQLFCQIFWGSCGRVPEFWFIPELVQSFPVSGLVCFLHQIQWFITLLSHLYKVALMGLIIHFQRKPYPNCWSIVYSNELYVFRIKSH